MNKDPHPLPTDELLPMREVERRHIQRVLTATGGNRTRAALILGFDRKTLYRKLLGYGLDAPLDSGSSDTTP